MSYNKTEIDFLEEINLKYSELEDDIEQRIQKLQHEEQKIQENADKVKKFNVEPVKKYCDSYEEAKKRNCEILKALEMSKARLRSRSTFSPIESILQKSIKNYMKEFSLIPIKNTQTKSYGPTFV